MATSLPPDILQVCAGWGGVVGGIQTSDPRPSGLLLTPILRLSLRRVFSLRKSFDLSHLPECEPVTRTAHPASLTHEAVEKLERPLGPPVGGGPSLYLGEGGCLSPQLKVKRDSVSVLFL